MIQGIDLDQAPVVLEQRRWQLAIMALSGAPFVAISILWMHDSGSWLPGVIGAFFGVALVFWLGAVARPARLTIAPDGLHFERLFRRRSWPWRAVSAVGGDRFDLWFQAEGRRVKLRVMDGIAGMEPVNDRGLRLVSGLRLAPILEQARERWS